MGNMNETFFNNLDAAATWSAGVAFKRSKALPLDKYSVFETKALAIEYAERKGAYAETPVSYPGQVIAVAENGKMVAYVLVEAADGSKLELQQIGVIPTGEGVVDVTEDGKISLLYDAPLYINDEGKLDVKVDGLTIEVANDAIALKAADKEVFKKDSEGNPTEEKVINAGAQLVLQADGSIKWVQPDTSTAEGQAAAISALQDRATALEKAAIKPAEGTEAKPEENLWDALAAEKEAREAADSVLEGLIGSASKPESSEGADDAEAATGVYIAIEAEVARAEAAEKALSDAIEALEKAEDERVDNDTTYTFADGSEGKFTVTPKEGEAFEIDTGAKDYVDAAIGTPAGDDYPHSTVYEAIDHVNTGLTALSDEIGTSEDAKERDTVYGKIAFEKDRAEEAEKALGERIDNINYVDADAYATDKQGFEKAHSDLDTAVKAAQKTADDAAAAAKEAQDTIDAFLSDEAEIAGTIDTLKEITAELEKLGDAVELEEQFAAKADKVKDAVAGNFAGLDADGNLTDSGKKAEDFATAEQGAKADAAAATIATYGDIVTHDVSEFATAAQGAKADAAAVKTDVEAEFAKYTTTEALTTLLAGKEAAGAAAKALEDAKADTDAKLANYYKNTEVDNLIKNFATTEEVAAAKSEAISDADGKLANKANTADVYSKTAIDAMDLASKTNVSEAVATEADRADKAEKALGVRIDELTAAAATKTALADVKATADAAATQTALQAEIDRATAAEGVNAGAIAAIKDHESVDSFADVVAELAKKQDKLVEGAYATEAYVDGKVKVATDAAAAADAKGAQGIADAATAKAAADAAQATANTNAANTDELEKVLYGRVITGTEEYPETVDTGLIGDLSDARTRLATAEGTIAGHTTAIGNINTALDTKADKTALQATDAHVAELERIVGKEAKDETPASGLVASVAALDSRLTAEETKVDKDTTYEFSYTSAAPGVLTVQPAGQDAYHVDLGVTAVADKAQEAYNLAGSASGAVQDLSNSFTNFENNVFGPVAGRVKTAEDDIDALQETIKGLSGAMHFKGVATSDPTAEGFDVSGYENGDVVIYGNKEYVFNVVDETGAFVEFGDATGNASAITELDGRVSAIETDIGEAPVDGEGGSGLKKDLFDLGLELNDVRTIAERAEQKGDDAYNDKLDEVKVVEGCGLTATRTEDEETGKKIVTIGWDNTVTIILDGGKA